MVTPLSSCISAVVRLGRPVQQVQLMDKSCIPCNSRQRFGGLGFVVDVYGLCLSSFESMLWP